MTETSKPMPVGRLICFLALFLATATASGLAARYLFAPSLASLTLDDPFASGTPWELTLAAARLLIPILCEFLAVLIFAFSPFVIPVSICISAERGARVSLMLCAAGTDAITVSAVCVYALAAALAALFCAECAVLSPKLRTLSFSSFNGRREAMLALICFFALSGGASLMTLGAGAILHLA